MFEIIKELLSQFVDMLPYMIGLYLIFDFTGQLLFGRK